MTDIEIDLPIEADELRDLGSRVTAVSIALITLLAAALGFLQAAAVRQSGDAEVEAQRIGVQAFGMLVDGETQAQLELGAYAASVEDTSMRWSLVQRAHTGDPAHMDALMAESETWAELAAIGAERTSIAREPRFAPEGDLAFPNRFLTERSRDGFVLSARQDALVEYGGAWGARAGAYAAILAVLAVSVYLLGLSLTVPGRRARRTFVVIGAVMAIGGLGLGVANWLSPPALAPDAAAEHFADGRVALLTAASQEDYAAAAAQFGEAITLRPTFALAYQNRASAEISAGSPQLGGYLSMAGLDALRAGRDDLRRALDLGIETRGLLANLGFYAYLIGLETGSPADLDEGIRLTRRAIDLDETEEVTGTDLALVGNLAVGLLAMGREADALSEYDRFIAALSATDPATDKRLDTGTAVYLAAGAITDLEVLLAKQSNLAGTVDALKARMAGAVAQAPGESPATATVKKTDAKVVFPGELQFEVDYDGIGDTDYLSVYWYRSAPDGSGWYVLPEVSGPLWYLDTDRELDVREEGSGSYVYLAPLIERSSPKRCVEGGDYRAELYLNNRRVDVVEGSADWDRLQPFLFRELGIAMCGAADWVRDAKREVGHTDGFASADGANGVYVMRLPASGQSLADTIEHALMRDGVPADLTETDSFTDYFLGLRTHLIKDYSYTGGRLRALAGFVPGENVHLVLMVFGPDAWWDGSDWADLINSARTFDIASAGDEPAVDPGPGNPSFGTPTFGAGIGTDGELTDTFAAAPGGSSQVCAAWSYEGMGAAAKWAATWLVDGKKVDGAGTAETKWTGGSLGTWSSCIGDGGQALAAGEYEIELSLQGEIVRTNDLFVGGSHPMADFRLSNASGTEICAAHVSLPSSGHWGPNDLADDATIPDGSSVTIRIPSGTYDLRIEDCDFETISDTFDIQVGRGGTTFVVERPG